MNVLKRKINSPTAHWILFVSILYCEIRLQQIIWWPVRTEPEIEKGVPLAKNNFLSYKSNGLSGSLKSSLMFNFNGSCQLQGTHISELWHRQIIFAWILRERFDLRNWYERRVPLQLLLIMKKKEMIEVLDGRLLVSLVSLNMIQVQLCIILLQNVMTHSNDFKQFKFDSKSKTRRRN